MGRKSLFSKEKPDLMSLC